ncbi:E3 ubiquitin-protein ligase RNF19B-like isoform 3-T3 [Cyanocitta cristata]
MRSHPVLGPAEQAERHRLQLGMVPLLPVMRPRRKPQAIGGETPPELEPEPEEPEETHVVLPLGEGQALEECPLCLLPQPPEAFPTLASCTHRSCWACLEQYLRLAVSESRVPVSCPHCPAALQPADVHRFLPEPALRDKYEEFLLRRLLVADPGIRWCPAPDCSYAVFAHGCAECPRLTCGREGCGTEFCYHCRQPWHPDGPCAPVPPVPSLATPTAQLAQPEELPHAEAEDIKVCPRCSAFIMKINDGSCNRMNCTVCGCLFCWLCLREISDVHFLSPSGCTFWGKRPWSRSRRILWQLGMVLGAPMVISLAAGVAVPVITIGIPIYMGRKVLAGGPGVPVVLLPTEPGSPWPLAWTDPQCSLLPTAHPCATPDGVSSSLPGPSAGPQQPLPVQMCSAWGVGSGWAKGGRVLGGLSRNTCAVAAVLLCLPVSEERQGCLELCQAGKRLCPWGYAEVFVEPFKSPSPFCLFLEVLGQSRRSSLSGCQQCLSVTSSVLLSLFVSPIITALTVGVGVPLMLTYVYGTVVLSLCRNRWGCRGSRTPGDLGVVELENLAKVNELWSVLPSPRPGEDGAPDPAASLPSSSRSPHPGPVRPEGDSQSASTVALAGSMLSEGQDVSDSGLPGAWALSATQGEPTCIAHPSISVLQPRDFTPAGADTADTDCLQRLMSTLCETPQKSYPGETGSHRPKPCCDPRPQGQMFSSPPTFLTSPSRKEPRIKTTPVFSGLLV